MDPPITKTRLNLIITFFIYQFQFCTFLVITIGLVRVTDLLESNLDMFKNLILSSQNPKKRKNELHSVRSRSVYELQIGLVGVEQIF